MTIATPAIDRAQAEYRKHAKSLDAVTIRDKVCELMCQFLTDTDGNIHNFGQSLQAVETELGGFRDDLLREGAAQFKLICDISDLFRIDRRTIVNVGHGTSVTFFDEVPQPDSIDWTGVSPLAMEQHCATMAKQLREADIPEGATIADLIEAHRQAVAVDESTFNEDGTSNNKQMSVITFAAEAGFFRNLVKAPCRTDEEVQAKIDYFLNGDVGDRETLLNNLLSDEYALDDNLLREFLQSLNITFPERRA
jgi:hypothetical protein